MCRACDDPGGPRRCPERRIGRQRTPEEKARKRELERERYAAARAAEGKGVRDYTRSKPDPKSRTSRPEKFAPPQTVFVSDAAEACARRLRTALKLASLPSEALPRLRPEDRELVRIVREIGLTADERGAMEPLARVEPGWVTSKGGLTELVPAEERDAVATALRLGRIRLI